LYESIYDISFGQLFFETVEGTSEGECLAGKRIDESFDGHSTKIRFYCHTLIQYFLSVEDETLSAVYSLSFAGVGG
jgi:hypothetical protein